MLKIYLLKILLTLLLVNLSGCSFLGSSHEGHGLQGHYYAGTQLNLARWHCWTRNDEGELQSLAIVGVGPFLTIDFALTVVADTFYAPVNLFSSVEKGPGLDLSEDSANTCSTMKK